ncbi:MAG: hypothetical protein ACUVWO_04015 [Thermodesulfobacteriota bacterium]
MEDFASPFIKEHYTFPAWVGATSVALISMSNECQKPNAKEYKRIYFFDMRGVCIILLTFVIWISFELSALKFDIPTGDEWMEPIWIEV